MGRNSRQSKILDLISKSEIETQEELSAELARAGIVVTQATVSRDIKELGLIKAAGENKKYKYAAPHIFQSGTSAKLINLFRESVISVDSAGNLVVIKTLSGSANAAASLVDKLALPQIMGCVAGDDTVLVIVKNADEVDGVVKKFNSLMD